MKKSDPKDGKGEAPPSKLIDARIKELSDWRGETLARIRALTREACPEVVEEWKWGIPVWSHAGLSGSAWPSAAPMAYVPQMLVSAVETDCYLPNGRKIMSEPEMQAVVSNMPGSPTAGEEFFTSKHLGTNLRFGQSAR